MKKTITILLFFALFATARSQYISVANPAGMTTIYTDLNLAIQDAEPGSTLYLSGGGFLLNDATKITKKLNIIGVGYRPDNDNAAGNTVIGGNLYFEENADHSVQMQLKLRKS